MSGLSEKERELLGVVQTRAASSIGELAELCEFPEHTVRYHLKSLKARGVIGAPLPFINVYRLGYSEHVFYFSVGNDVGDRREKLLERIASAPGVAWFLELRGDFEYSASVCAFHVSEVAELLASIVAGLGDIISAKELTTRLKSSYFGVRSFTPGCTKSNPLVIGGRPGPAEIDECDHKLLYHMARGESSSVRELAKVSSVPYSTGERRKRKLEESGVIAGYIYRAALETLGCSFAKLRVRHSGVNPETTERLRQFCRERAEVVGLVECMGLWDYELNLSLLREEDLAEFMSLCAACLGENVEFLPVLWIGRYRKRHNYPFYKN